MSQFGMQMPGGRAGQGPTPDVYTGLMLFAVLFLLAAVVFVALAGAKVSPDGQPWSLQDVDRIQISE